MAARKEMVLLRAYNMADRGGVPGTDLDGTTPLQAQRHRLGENIGLSGTRYVQHAPSSVCREHAELPRAVCVWLREAVCAIVLRDVICVKAKV